MILPYRLGVVVEGHSEVESAPILLRRLIMHFDPNAFVLVVHPVRVTKSKLLKDAELERAVELAARHALAKAGRPVVFVLLDADDDCPAQLGPSLLARARNQRSDCPVSIVVAKAEFESWFLAAANSLGGVCDLPVVLTAPSNPEGIRDAKGWLEQYMPQGRSYSEVVDQPVLTRVFDLEQARAADSFDKCYREVQALI